MFEGELGGDMRGVGFDGVGTSTIAVWIRHATQARCTGQSSFVQDLSPVGGFVEGWR